MKRFLAILCAMALMLGCCSFAVADSAEAIELQVWMMGTVDQKDSDVVWAAYNEELQKVMPGVTVNFYLPADYAQAYNMAMASGEQIDLAWTGWTHNLPEEARLGNLLPLDDLIQQYGQGIIETLGQANLDMHRIYDNQLYQVPSYQGLCGTTAYFFPMEIVDTMREDWIADMDANWKARSQGFTNVSYEESVALVDQYVALITEYMEAAEALGKVGLGLNTQHLPAYVSDGSTFDRYEFGMNKDLQIIPRYTLEGLQYEAQKKQATLRAEWYEKGWIPSDIVSLVANKGANKQWVGALTAEDAISGHTSYGDTLEKAAKRAAITTQSDIVMFCTRPWMADVGNATGMSVPYTSKYPEEAVMLMNEMYINEPLFTIWTYGLKDVHYTENEDGSIVTLGGTGQAKSDWAYGQWKWTFGNSTLAKQTQAETEDPAIALIDNLEKLKQCYVRPFHLWNMNWENVENENANVTAIISEYKDQLTYGLLGVEETLKLLEKRNTEILAAGYDKILAEAQVQCDAYAEINGITTLGEEYLLTQEWESAVVVRYEDVK